MFSPVKTVENVAFGSKERNGMRRNNRIEFTVNATERESIEAKARAAGLPVAALARSAILGLNLPVRRVNVEAEAVAALNRVGSNLNQLARIGNASGTLSKEQIRALSGLYQRIGNTVHQIEKSAHAQ